MCERACGCQSIKKHAGCNSFPPLSARFTIGFVVPSSLTDAAARAADRLYPPHSTLPSHAPIDRSAVPPPPFMKIKARSKQTERQLCVQEQDAPCNSARQTPPLAISRREDRRHRTHYSCLSARQALTERTRTHVHINRGPKKGQPASRSLRPSVGRERKEAGAGAGASSSRVVVSVAGPLSPLLFLLPIDRSKLQNGGGGAGEKGTGTCNRPSVQCVCTCVCD